MEHGMDQNPLVSRIGHVGMVVPNLTAAETFFIDAFGAEVLYRPGDV